MNLRILSVSLALLLMAGSASAAEPSGSWWQLVFQYDQTNLRLIQATPFAASGKTPTTPGLPGTPVRLSYRASWQDAGGVELANSTVDIPLGFRSAPSDSDPCIMQVPDRGIVVVRTTGPGPESNCSALKLTFVASMKRQPDLAVPSSFDFSVITLPVSSRSLRPAVGPVGVTKLRDTGPDQNRFVIVVLGDGYTASQVSSGLFTAHTSTLLSALNSYGPWDVLFNGTNIYRIDVESNQSGADMDPYGTYKDTYFNSSFWVENIERLLAIDGQGYSRAIAAADAFVGPGLWDQLVIQVNSSKYGGSGGAISVISAHSSAPQILIHEMGHSFANLADEYSDPYPGYPPGDDEPNVDFDASGPGLKWLPWVKPTTPLPTPPSSPYLTVIGAFEGARYLTTGIYRPVYSCMMRTLSAVFDSVCQEAQLASYFTLTSMLDSAVPSLSSVNPIPPDGRTFTAIALPVGGLTYQWMLDDSVITDTTGPTFSLSLQQLIDHGLSLQNTLRLRVSYLSARMRLIQPADDYTWILQPDCNNNGIDDSADIISHTSLDSNHNGVPDECEVITCCSGTTGDVNLVGIVDLADLSMLIAYLIDMPRPTLPCAEEANINGIGIIDLSDLSMLVAYLTASPPPALPNCP